MTFMSVLLMLAVMHGLYWGFLMVLLAAVAGGAACFFLCLVGCVILAALYHGDRRRNGSDAREWKRILAIILGVAAGLAAVGVAVRLAFLL